MPQVEPFFSWACYLAILLILQGSEALRNPVKSIISFMSAKTFFLSSLVKRQTKCHIFKV